MKESSQKDQDHKSIQNRQKKLKKKSKKAISH